MRSSGTWYGVRYCPGRGEVKQPYVWLWVTELIEAITGGWRLVLKEKIMYAFPYIPVLINSVWADSTCFGLSCMFLYYI